MKKIILGALVFVGMVGCATAAPPNELVAARARYQQASQGEAARLNPAGLYEARKALAIANKSYDEDGTGGQTRDLSYLALRKVQLAELNAQVLSSTHAKDVAYQKKMRTTEDQLKATREQYRGTQQSLEQTNKDLEASKRDLELRGKELEEEKQARAAAEAREKQVADELAKVSAVSKDDRGLVLTLSGSVLFVSGQDTLLPQAKQRLDEVATALKKAKAGGFVVEGHTDGIGSDQLNDDLSRRRAESVRSYLVSQGVPAEDIKAVGLGKRNPIATNDTAEGRANNRRVEIVIQPASQVATQR
jgi:outer membrane protein OmpA-like peptidoglycan-associated protein